MVMRQQQLLPLLADLNAAFSVHKISDVAEHNRESFAPGNPLAPALGALVGEIGSPANTMFQLFVNMMPMSIQQSTSAIIRYCLTSSPPVLITWAWAPGYDFELTVWEAVEPAPALSSVTILVKSRYPDDPHPLSSVAAI